MLIDALLVSLLHKVRRLLPSQPYPRWMIWLWNVLRWTERPFRIRRRRLPRRRRALLSYIKRPFKYPHLKHVHAAFQKAPIIAAVLDQLGFDVDVLDFTSEYRVNYRDYELIFGFGQPLFNSFKSPFAGPRVYFATGADPNFSNHAEAMRLRSLRDRRHVLLRPMRTVSHEWGVSVTLSDLIVCLGNEWSMGTYRQYNMRTVCLPVTYCYHWPAELVPRETQRISRQFIWFGGSGAVHKGLDLVLEAMDLVGDGCALHVCGPISAEGDFIDLYREHLYQRHDVNYHGLVDIRSPEFLRLMNVCAFVVLPSCSEGGGSSVLTCMHYGLIPVVTRESSVETLDFGIVIADATPASVARAMQQAYQLGPNELERRSRAAQEYCWNCQGVEQFRSALKDSLEAVLSPTGTAEHDAALAQVK
jgi:glycosyltransferase involved in cell wall biosynthesis